MRFDNNKLFLELIKEKESGKQIDFQKILCGKYLDFGSLSLLRSCRMKSLSNTNIEKINEDNGHQQDPTFFCPPPFSTNNKSMKNSSSEREANTSYRHGAKEGSCRSCVHRIAYKHILTPIASNANRANIAMIHFEILLVL
ncbi:CLUMA_CG013932, isoform A [Clunio marinus]|uniref:CLUMA_CG013932, isoform A n=1 Tax=Clunio marinus TaxID=568069 RepID=A0A1J1IKG8_9DIPT|nr:CLUMA_CG013932, isoform A [Clunio marinus]